MGAPAVTFSVEPEVGGDLVYLRVAPASADAPPRGMLGLNLRMKNDGAAAVRLERIRVSFPGHLRLTREFARDTTVEPGKAASVFLDPDEAVFLPGNAPASAVIELFFTGFDQAVALQRTLRAHVNNGPGGSYRFPGRVTDMEEDEYFTQKARHTGGQQFFGYDIVVEGWDEARQEFNTLRPGADPDTNESRRGWGRPVYAMAGGTVLSVRNDRDENPPGKRSIQRLDDASAGLVGALTVTRLSDTRVATVVRTMEGTLKVIVWDTAQDGADIVRRGDAGAGAVTAVAADALSSKQLVTAARRSDGLLEVRVWSVSEDGMVVRPVAQRLTAAVHTVSVAKLSAARFATAARTAEGSLRLIVWDVDGTELLIRSHAFAGEVRAVSTTALDAARLVTAVRTGGDDLKLIAWTVSDDGELTRRASAGGGAISTVASAVLAGSTLATCARLASGTLKVTAWNVSEDGGEITRLADATGGAVSALAAAPAVNGAVVTAAATADGLDVAAWHYDPDKAALVHWGAAAAGPAGLPSVDRLGSGTFLTAVRAADGTLKLISWHLGSGGGNCVRILHGDEIVLYAHFVKGSIPAAVQPGATVAVGQFLGRMGNSGSSGGVHLHVHAVAKPAGMTAAQMVEAAQKEALAEGAFRPLPFNGAQAVREEILRPVAEGDNPFTTLANHGLYYDRMAVWPGVTTPGVPAERHLAREVEPAGGATVEVALDEGHPA